LVCRATVESLVRAGRAAQLLTTHGRNRAARAA
jgi:hypothetical protein